MTSTGATPSCRSATSTSPTAARVAACRPCAGVSLDVHQGETVGVAGESGCGKSTMAMALLRLLPAGTKTEGQILLDGDDVLAMKPGRLRAVRWAGASIVFQGAQHVLNPVQRIGDQINEAIKTHKVKGTTAAQPAGAGRAAADGEPATTRTSSPAARSNG